MAGNIETSISKSINSFRIKTILLDKSNA
jgi:hypothetical protein